MQTHRHQADILIIGGGVCGLNAALTAREQGRSVIVMDKAVIDKAIDQALAESHEQGIHGKETTPFLLARVAELTGGDSLESNIQLVLNNARVAAKTAVALCK